MAVFFRVGSIIPCFAREIVSKARSTEDLIGDNLSIVLKLVPGRKDDQLRCDGCLYLDDFRSHAYQQMDYAEFKLEATFDDQCQVTSQTITNINEHSKNAEQLKERISFEPIVKIN